MKAKLVKENISESITTDDIITIDVCPLCKKSHKFHKINTKLKKYTQMFICPNTKKMFQASISVN